MQRKVIFFIDFYTSCIQMLLNIHVQNTARALYNHELDVFLFLAMHRNIMQIYSVIGLLPWLAWCMNCIFVGLPWPCCVHTSVSVCCSTQCQLLSEHVPSSSILRMMQFVWSKTCVLANNKTVQVALSGGNFHLELYDVTHGAMHELPRVASRSRASPFWPSVCVHSSRRVLLWTRTGEVPGNEAA